MNQHTHKANNKEWLLVNTGSNNRTFFTNNGHTFWYASEDQDYPRNYLELGPSQWKIIGRVIDLSEQQCQELTEQLPDMRYKSYMPDIESFSTATGSVTSLCVSLGWKKTENVVVLQKN